MKDRGLQLEPWHELGLAPVLRPALAVPAVLPGVPAVGLAVEPRVVALAADSVVVAAVTRERVGAVAVPHDAHIRIPQAEVRTETQYPLQK